MTEKWLVIDAHTHFLPEEAVAQAASDGFDFSTIWEENERKRSGMATYDKIGTSNHKN